MSGPWLYPYSAELDLYAFEDPGGYEQPTTFEGFIDEYDRMVRTGQNVTDWLLAQNGDDAEVGDEVWADSCKHNGDQGICGLAEIAWLDVPAGRIGLRWDLTATGLLIAHPFPGLELRQEFGYGAGLPRRKRALTRLDPHPHLVVLLHHHVAVLRKHGRRLSA